MATDDGVVPTMCEDWSLNADEESDRRFWWNATYSLSVWEETLKTGDDVAELTDTDVWRKYLNFQLGYVYKLCPVCEEPECNVDMMLCCYCGGTVHRRCSLEANTNQIKWKEANEGLEGLMRVCFECEWRPHEKTGPLQASRKADDPRRAAKRMLSLESELSPEVFTKMKQLFLRADKDKDNSPELMQEVMALTRDVFQSKESLSLLTKGNIASKGGGIGVVAAADIPAFTVIGVYPGYRDDLSGEQAKVGRPVPKYALMDLNCADYFNNVFVEFGDTFTPFINEPCENEVSNCAWIQEPNHPEGRLSIISVAPVKKGEELLIGYGPLYPRSYPHRYDAYAFHPVEGYSDPTCYALWRWPSTEENDATFVCYVGQSKSTGKYMYWESQSEYEASLGKQKPQR